MRKKERKSREVKKLVIIHPNHPSPKEESNKKNPSNIIYFTDLKAEK